MGGPTPPDHLSPKPPPPRPQPRSGEGEWGRVWSSLEQIRRDNLSATDAGQPGTSTGPLVPGSAPRLRPASGEPRNRGHLPWQPGDHAVAWTDYCGDEDGSNSSGIGYNSVDHPKCKLKQRHPVRADCDVYTPSKALSVSVDGVEAHREVRAQLQLWRGSSPTTRRDTNHPEPLVAAF